MTCRDLQGVYTHRTRALLTIHAVVGKDGPGRSKSSARGTALIGAADDYDPASDTCIEAFALDLAALAADAQQTAA